MSKNWTTWLAFHSAELVVLHFELQIVLLWTQNQHFNCTKFDFVTTQIHLELYILRRTLHQKALVYEHVIAVFESLILLTLFR